MERRRIRTAIVAMVGCDNGVDHDAVMYMGGGGDSHIVHRINRFSKTHMTREYQFEVDFACSLWFAISFLIVLIPLVVPDGAIGLCLQLLSSCSAFLPIRPVPFAIFAADANACVQRTISHWPKPIDCIWASLYLAYFFGGMLTYILVSMSAAKIDYKGE